MRAIMLMFDTLNRNFLPNYGCDWIHAPNFERLGRKTVAFQNCYAGSLPCMPARRDLQTGRLNFLHRAWGPMEPFDDSLPENLKRQGIYTHLITDHYHYFEDGGCTYHTRYSSWEFARGQEADPWKGVAGRVYRDKNAIGHIEDEELLAAELLSPLDYETLAVGPAGPNDYLWDKYWINRKYISSDSQQPQTIAMNLSEEFIRTNVLEDNWFLQIELFDPHEPFYCDKKYKELYPHTYDGRRFDWPTYTKVKETPEEIEHLRFEYAALVSKCDESLGRLLDLMDEYDMWDDTMLIVNTDHGFLLGEHGWIAKNLPPVYNEIAHLPLFIWDPRCKQKGIKAYSLVQTIDIVPTLYQFFEQSIPKDVMGADLALTIRRDAPVREYALFGYHTGHLNITDGRYVYMLAPKDTNHMELYNYTLMPTHVVSMFSKEELQTMELAGPFDFTKGLRVLKVKAPGAVKNIQRVQQKTMLFDLMEDPAQQACICIPDVEERMRDAIQKLLQANDAPKELFDRFSLSTKKEVSSSCPK